MRTLVMTHAHNAFRPWWRRRWWPLACGTASGFLACVLLLTSHWCPWFECKRRIDLWIEKGQLILHVHDDELTAWGIKHLGPQGYECGLASGRRAMDPASPWCGFEKPDSRSRVSVIDNGGTTIGHFFTVDVPLGWPTAVPAVISAWGFSQLWRRRWLPGQCWACGYDKSDLAPSSRCPECGKAGV